MPFGQELVLATSSAEARRGSPALLVPLLETLEHGPQVRVELATGSDLTPATGVWLACSVRR
jgi:hypothetical protein